MFEAKKNSIQRSMLCKKDTLKAIEISIDDIYLEIVPLLISMNFIQSWFHNFVCAYNFFLMNLSV